MSDQSFMNGGGESVRQNDRRREYSGVVPMKQPNKSGRPPAEASGGKANDQGEHATTQPVPDAEPGKRDKRVGACAGSSQAGRGSEVHSAAAPCKHRPAPGQLLQPEETGGARSGMG